MATRRTAANQQRRVSTSSSTDSWSVVRAGSRNGEDDDDDDDEEEREGTRNDSDSEEDISVGLEADEHYDGRDHDDDDNSDTEHSVPFTDSDQEFSDQDEEEVEQEEEDEIEPAEEEKERALAEEEEAEHQAIREQEEENAQLDDSEGSEVSQSESDDDEEEEEKEEEEGEEEEEEEEDENEDDDSVSVVDEAEGYSEPAALHYAPAHKIASQLDVLSDSRDGLFWRVARDEGGARVIVLGSVVTACLVAALSAHVIQGSWMLRKPTDPSSVFLHFQSTDNAWVRYPTARDEFGVGLPSRRLVSWSRSGAQRHFTTQGGGVPVASHHARRLRRDATATATTTSDDVRQVLRFLEQRPRSSLLNDWTVAAAAATEGSCRVTRLSTPTSALQRAVRSFTANVSSSWQCSASDYSSAVARLARLRRHALHSAIQQHRNNWTCSLAPLCELLDAPLVSEPRGPPRACCDVPTLLRIPLPSAVLSPPPSALLAPPAAVASALISSVCRRLVPRSKQPAGAAQKQKYTATWRAAARKLAELSRLEDAKKAQGWFEAFTHSLLNVSRDARTRKTAVAKAVRTDVAIRRDWTSTHCVMPFNLTVRQPPRSLLLLPSTPPCSSQRKPCGYRNQKPCLLEQKPKKEQEQRQRRQQQQQQLRRRLPVCSASKPPPREPQQYRQKKTRGDWQFERSRRREQMRRNWTRNSRAVLYNF